MAAEDRKWLEEAMDSMMVDEAARMTEIVERLEEMRVGTVPLDEDVLEGLFEELQDIVEQIDQAMNLHKIGKLETLVAMLRDEKAVFRWHAAEIIATAVQNNPKVQAVAIKLGALAFSAHLFVYDEDATVRAKSLLALSCMVRNFPPGEGSFAAGDGVFVICRGVCDKDERVATKSIHLLGYLLAVDEAIRTEEVRKVYAQKSLEFGVAEPLIQLALTSDAVDMAEGSLVALQRLTEIGGAGCLDASAKPRFEERFAALSALEGEAREDAQVQLDLLTLLIGQLGL